MRKTNLKEEWTINPNAVDLSQLPQFIEVYSDYKHGRVEDTILSTVKKSSPKFLTPNTYAYVISNKLFYFLYSWSIPVHGKEHSIYRYMNTITFNTNKKRDAVKLYHDMESNPYYYIQANHDLYTYNCNPRTAYKDLNKLLKLKQSIDKIAKIKNKKINISANNLILASRLQEKEAIQYLSKFSFSSISHLSNSAEFKHYFKLCHSATTTDILHL